MRTRSSGGPIKVTSARAYELEREIRAVEVRLSKRILAAEARADAASARADLILETLTNLLRRRVA